MRLVDMKSTDVGTPGTAARDALRRIGQYEAILGQITVGVALLEPVHGPDGQTLELVMANEIAAAYFGRLDTDDHLQSTGDGFKNSGLFDLALLVSLTGAEHFQEAVRAPGAAAAGSSIDLAITPFDDGAVAITFNDVTHAVQHRNSR